MSTALSVPRLSFDEFMAFGRRALGRADVPVVITLPGEFHGHSVVDRLGDMVVTVFTEPNDRRNPLRFRTEEIRLREFFTDQYQRDPGAWHRVVSNLRDNPADIDALLGFDAEALFDYRHRLNAANLWISHRGVFTQCHFDELENFNIALAGRKRFVMAPPGYADYYPRSLLRGFGDKSQAFDLDDVDPARFPRLAPKLAQRRELILEPGQMLYLPLGWWHQVESLDELNININFWLPDRKIFRRPHVLGVALGTVAYRKLKGVYTYKPVKQRAS
ncbi:cupin-like domain-containing protein [Actinophytocola sp.]|uniref:cupin-like domain-containing protein n=1 Tax=Actinophytocola sp. TaxID=1872138 RepID=UPI002ED46D4C